MAQITYLLRSTEPRLPHEVYETRTEAWDEWREWPAEYEVVELHADGTWKDVTRAWEAELARSQPIREYA